MRKLFLLLFLVTSASYAEPCPAELLLPAQKVKASASVFDNVFGREGTLQELISVTLKDAFKKLPEQSCPSECIKTGEKINLKIYPVKVTENYRDKDYCDEKLQQTTNEPLIYEDNSVNNLSELDDWINDVSRAKNEVGEDVYERCDKDCSPRYELLITGTADKLETDALVVCGHKRDKSENYYWLEASIVLSCKQERG